MNIGVYICHCGVNIASTVDIEEVRDFACRQPKVAIARDYLYLCSDPGQDLIKNDIKTLALDRVVIAACSPRMHEITFRKALQSAGLNPYFLQIANIREQCSWVHPDKKQGTQKARELVAAALARVSRHEPLRETEASVVCRVLVIGGGIAGIQSSLDIAEAGFEVCLVEKSPALGGHVAQLNRTFPHFEDVSPMLQDKIDAVRQHPLIQVLTNSEVTALDGYVGNFRAKVQQHLRMADGENGQRCVSASPQGAEGFPEREAISEVDIGTIIVATGYDVFDARRKPEYGYGHYENVITALEFEQLLSPRGPAQGHVLVGGKEPRTIVFIQCVGSRDKTVGNEYCSRVCCMYTATQARTLKELMPEAKITVCYIDVRAFGKGCEQFYEGVQKLGVLYRKGIPSEIFQRGEKLVVKAEDELLGEAYEEEADLVVLATGLTKRADAGEIGGLLKLAKGPDQFYLEAHPKLRPLDTSMEGIYLAGACHGPKDITDTLAQAHGAASRATSILFAGRVVIDPVTSVVDELLCAGCGLCEKVCEYGALKIDPYQQVMTVNEALCQGCGACQAACPSGAMSVKHFKKEQIMAQIDRL